MTGRQTVVMVTTSYPRFPGDTIGTFMEPIVHGLAARGHEVHVVLPWHPLLQRPAREGGVHFHPFHYAPLAALNVFGYADALKADVRLRWSAYAAAPLALTAGWNKARTIARSVDATIVHAHWVVPGGVIGAASAGHRPLVISLHGSDVYVAERHSLARRLARAAFRRAAWTTACSDDLRRRAIAIGAPPDRAEIIPYGVDADRFRPDAATRASVRRRLGVGENEPMLFSAGRFVHKKGFEYLIDAAAILVSEWPGLRLVIAGAGDLDAELRRRVDENPRVVDRVRFVGVLAHEQIADFLAAADLAVVPSVHDDEGNVDGLPNFALEALASGTAVVATTAGGLSAAINSGRTGLLVPERDTAALASSIDKLLRDADLRQTLGRNARDESERQRGWPAVAERFEAVYGRARALPPKSLSC